MIQCCPTLTGVVVFVIRSGAIMDGTNEQVPPRRSRAGRRRARAISSMRRRQRFCAAAIQLCTVSRCTSS